MGWGRRAENIQHYINWPNAAETQVTEVRRVFVCLGSVEVVEDVDKCNFGEVVRMETTLGWIRNE